MKTIDVGAISEVAVMYDLLKRNYNILKPEKATAYDLVVELLDGSLLKLQIKTARPHSQSKSGVLITLNRYYEANDVDLLAVYERVTSHIYYIPICDVPRKKIIYLNHKQLEQYKDFPCEVKTA